MELNYFQINEQTIAELLSDEIVIKTTQDALDIMANAQYQDANHIIWYQKNIASDFFELGIGLAGEILQKFSNYQMRLVVIADLEKFSSKSLKAFIIESNRGKQISFVTDKNAALDKLVRLT